MKNIVLCTEKSGISTRLLIERMKIVAKQQNKDYNIWTIEISNLESNFIMNNKIDVILMIPQIKYKLSYTKKICDNYLIPVDVINLLDYSRMNGENVLKFALNLISNSKTRVI